MATVTLQQAPMLQSSNDRIFAQDDRFWKNYNKGRPQVPSSFLERIFTYHREQGGQFGTAHDAGAGDGVHSASLRAQFQHVIVSDIVPENVRQAENKLGLDGYSYRAHKIEEIDEIAPGSVDLVFIMNALHWAEQRIAMQVVATQLRRGGTFACAGFGPARFRDGDVQALWERISQEGGRVLLKDAVDPVATLGVMARSEGLYNNAPLDLKYFRPGAKRIHLNMGQGGLTGLIPPETRHQVSEPEHTGPDDIAVFERDDDWRFELDLAGFREHFHTFPHASKEPAAFASMLQELEDLVKNGTRLDGHWPVTLILATRG